MAKLAIFTTDETTEPVLQQRLQKLHDKGDRAKTCTNVDQASGVVLVASGASLLALGIPTAGVVPLALGAIAYGVAVFNEARVTGEIRPIPFVELGIGEMLAQADKTNEQQSSDAFCSTGYHYLSPIEKAEYVLLSMAGKDIATRLDLLSGDYERSHAYKHLVEAFHELYNPHIKQSPYALKGVSKADILDHFMAPSNAAITPVATAAPIGNQTRLEAVDVPVAQSVTVDLEPAPTNEQEEQAVTQIKILGLGMAQPLQPVMIVGSPGAGKGITSSSMLALTTQQGAEVWVVDPKSDVKEAKYWAKVKRHYLIDPTVNDDIGECILGVLEEFEQRQFARKNGREDDSKPLILLLDEVNTIVANLTKPQLEIFGRKVINLAAQGRSQNCALWIGCQAVILKQLGIEGASNRDIFTQVVCVNGSDRTKAKNILSTLGMDANRLTGLSNDQFYWVTNDETIEAPLLECVPVSGWGSNVIDLRPADAVADVEEFKAVEVISKTADLSIKEINSLIVNKLVMAGKEWTHLDDIKSLFNGNNLAQAKEMIMGALKSGKIESKQGGFVRVRSNG